MTAHRGPLDAEEIEFFASWSAEKTSARLILDLNSALVAALKERDALQTQLTRARSDRDFAIQLLDRAKKALIWIERDTRDPTALNSRSNQCARIALKELENPPKSSEPPQGTP